MVAQRRRPHYHSPAEHVSRLPLIIVVWSVRIATNGPPYDATLIRACGKQSWAYWRRALEPPRLNTGNVLLHLRLGPHRTHIIVLTATHTDRLFASAYACTSILSFLQSSFAPRSFQPQAFILCCQYHRTPLPDCLCHPCHSHACSHSSRPMSDTSIVANQRRAPWTAFYVPPDQTMPRLYASQPCTAYAPPDLLRPASGYACQWWPCALSHVAAVLLHARSPTGSTGSFQGPLVPARDRSLGTSNQHVH